ncbi:MAG: GNAT family N-acetyltransferase [Candidatus Saccharimonadaceae bacterium]
MIQYATPNTQDQILEMWKICFGDSKPYIDIYFKEKYRNENTLAYFVGEKVVASLQLLQFNFTFCNSEIPVAYISGACTLPEARNKGYMAQLLNRALHEIGQRDIPLSILVPQEEWLLNFYNKFGYAQTFDEGQDLLSLEDLINEYPNNLHSAYSKFDRFFRTQEMTVQKSFDDFRVIVDEAAAFDFPSKKSLIGMARVIDARKMLELFAKKYPEKNFSVEITDTILNQNCQLLVVDKGIVLETKSKRIIHLNLTIYDLAQALLGYHTSKKQAPYRSIFPEHQPQMHFMLE